MKTLRFQTDAGSDAERNAAPALNGQGALIDGEGAEGAERDSRAAREGQEAAGDEDRAPLRARYGHVRANLEGWPRATCGDAASDVLALDGRGVSEGAHACAPGRGRSAGLREGASIVEARRCGGEEGGKSRVAGSAGQGNDTSLVVQGRVLRAAAASSVHVVEDRGEAGPGVRGDLETKRLGETVDGVEWRGGSSGEGNAPSQLEQRLHAMAHEKHALSKGERRRLSLQRLLHSEGQGMQRRVGEKGGKTWSTSLRHFGEYTQRTRRHARACVYQP
jgi:hypothetical protein